MKGSRKYGMQVSRRGIRRCEITENKKSGEEAVTEKTREGKEGGSAARPTVDSR